MVIAELRPRVHGTAGEIKFIRQVGNTIAAAGYRGPIQVVGSRADAEWISRKAANDCLQELSARDRQEWGARLNQMAKKNLLPRGAIFKLADMLDDAAAPESVFNLLEGLCGEPGSDFDLFIEQRPSGVDLVYFDKPYPGGTGQTADIFDPQVFHHP